MKHAIALISSLAIVTLPAHAQVKHDDIFHIKRESKCVALAGDHGAQQIWSEFSLKFGAIPLPKSVALCYGKKWFFTIKGGAIMQSVLDRKNQRILLRRHDTNLLRHELAHLYLDLRWKVLPYSIAEPLANALATAELCPQNQNSLLASEALHERWRMRSALDTCGLQQLLQDIFSADKETRESLPLR